MRHELTFHVLRLTLVGASLNVVLMISILILIRILFTKQPTEVASATPARPAMKSPGYKTAPDNSG